MGYDYIEAARMYCNSLDHIIQSLNDLERKGTWMRRILPDHESLVRCCGDQDWLLHAGGNSGELEPMEWNCQVRDLSELFLLLLLDAHLEDLSFTCGVH